MNGRKAKDRAFRNEYITHDDEIPGITADGLGHQLLNF